MTFMSSHVFGVARARVGPPLGQGGHVCVETRRKKGRPWSVIDQKKIMLVVYGNPWTVLGRRGIICHHRSARQGHVILLLPVADHCGSEGKR